MLAHTERATTKRTLLASLGGKWDPHRRRTRDQACICAWFPTEVAKVAVADLNDARDTVAENSAESEEAISVEVDVSDMSSTWNMAAITLTW